MRRERERENDIERERKIAMREKKTNKGRKTKVEKIYSGKLREMEKGRGVGERVYGDRRKRP